MHVAPRTLDTGVAALFVVGSGLFVLGSVPAYIHAVGATADAVTYAVGALFFTAAALGQLVQAQDPALVEVSVATERTPVRVPRWAWRPHERSWAAAVVQFPGTLCFNVSTVAALVHNATVAEEDHRVWRPDVYGSVLFLVAGVLGVLAAGRVAGVRLRSAGWWLARINLAGCVAFLFSAVASYVLPSSGDLVSAPVTVGGTLVGAACFLIGAALVPVSWQQDLATT